MALARANQDLILIQGYCQDKFRRYTNGLPGAGDSLEVIYESRNRDAASAARWNNLLGRVPIPRPANRQFSLWHRQRLRAIATDRRLPYRGWELPIFPRPDRESQGPIRGQLNNFRDLLRSTFRYVKCVGWGRDGVLTLWRYRPSRGQEFRVVMKQSALAGRPRGQPRARLGYNTFNIMRERNIMTVSPNCKPSSSLSGFLGMLTNRCLSDAVSSTPHCATVLHGGSSSRRSCDPR